jgi:hypothetical protein
MISFEQARRIAANSPEVLRWFEPAGVEIAESGLENSADYILTGRAPGEPWWHKTRDTIPGPPMIVVSKASGAVRRSSAPRCPTTKTALRNSRRSATCLTTPSTTGKRATRNAPGMTSGRFSLSYARRAAASLPSRAASTLPSTSTLVIL